MLNQLTSTSVVSLSVAEVVGIVMFIITSLAGVAAFVRKDERDKVRLNTNEKNIENLTLQVKHLMEQVGELTGIIKELTRAPRTKV